MQKLRGFDFTKNEKEDFVNAAKAIQKAINDNPRYLDDAEGLAALINKCLPDYQCIERQKLNDIHSAN